MNLQRRSLKVLIDSGTSESIVEIARKPSERMCAYVLCLCVGIFTILVLFVESIDGAL